MGKARRKLAAARKECFDKINHKEVSEKDNPEEYFANIKQKGIEYDEESVYLLQQELFKYCCDGSFPLCEFLDKQNTINYIKHVIKK